MTKPISPSQLHEAVNPTDKRAHLKKLVTRRLNRELKRGLSCVRVPNYTEPDLAAEIADEFAAAGWAVHIEDQRHTMSGTAWVFTLSITFKVGELVMVDMIDRQSWPDVFPGKVIDSEPAGPRQERYLIEYQDGAGATKTIWLLSCYLERKAT